MVTVEEQMFVLLIVIVSIPSIVLEIHPLNIDESRVTEELKQA